MGDRSFILGDRSSEKRKGDRTSELEKQVMSLLAKENQPVNLAKLLEKAQISSSDLLNALGRNR